jgi:hypothetical protein
MSALISGWKHGDGEVNLLWTGCDCLQRRGAATTKTAAREAPAK